MPQNHTKFIWTSVLILIGLLIISGAMYAAYHRIDNSAPADSSAVIDQNTSSNGQNTASQGTNQPTNVSEANVKNATYNVWSNTESVTLKDGQYNDANAHISSTLTHYALGDINHDGLTEGLAAVSTVRGDSADELFLVQSKNGRIESSLLPIPVGGGNSVRTINSVSINSKGMINMNLSVLGPNDAHCCASIQGSYNFTFDGKHLIGA